MKIEKNRSNFIFPSIRKSVESEESTISSPSSDLPSCRCRRQIQASMWFYHICCLKDIHLINTLSFYGSKIDLTRTNITWLGQKTFGWVKIILDLDQKWLFTTEFAFLTNIQKDSDFALNKRLRKIPYKYSNTLLESKFFFVQPKIFWTGP